MNRSLEIFPELPLQRRRNDTFIFLLAVVVITCTFLRVSLVVIYPLLTLFIAVFYRWRLTAYTFIAFFFIFVSFVLSFTGGIFLKYKLLSLFYMVPLIALLFSRIGREKEDFTAHLEMFMKCLAAVLFINDIVGLFQVFTRGKSDDNFLGIYSQFSVSLNGLSLMNAVVFFYYFMCYLQSRRYIFLTISIFFLTCSILGFYGAGLIACIIAFVFSFFKFRFVSLLKIIFVGVATIGTIYLVMLYVKPITLGYNITNIKKFISLDIEKGPRKIKAFHNYAISYPEDMKDFLFGSGPGTFNSRSAFMVGSPSYFRELQIIKDNEKPYYFQHYAYSLWNESNTSQAQYLDGFRNQPFSSLLAFLGEYGLIFTLIFILLLYAYYKKSARLYHACKDSSKAHIYFRVFKFLMILLVLLLAIDNYFEYPEIILPIALGMQFSQYGLLCLYNADLKKRQI